MRSKLTYAAKNRAEPLKTKLILRITEIKTLKTVKGATLRQQIRSDNIRSECNVHGWEPEGEIRGTMWIGWKTNGQSVQNTKNLVPADCLKDQLKSEKRTGPLYHKRLNQWKKTGLSPTIYKKRQIWQCHFPLYRLLSAYFSSTIIFTYCIPQVSTAKLPKKKKQIFYSEIYFKCFFFNRNWLGNL